MKRFASAVIVCILLFAVSEAAHAKEAKPIQLALFTPIQIFDESTPIHGFRFSLIYGSNSEMYGFDLGLVNRVKGKTAGYQVGIVGMSETFWGLQSNWAVNKADVLAGVQWGAVNLAEQVTGVQFAIVNFATTLKGVQIGLINIADNGFLPVFPFFNFGVNK